MSDLYDGVPITREEASPARPLPRPRFATDQIWAFAELAPDALNRPPSPAFAALLRDPATYQLPSIISFWRCLVCREYTVAPSAQLGYCSRCGTARPSEDHPMRTTAFDPANFGAAPTRARDSTSAIQAAIDAANAANAEAPDVNEILRGDEIRPPQRRSSER